MLYQCKGLIRFLICLCLTPLSGLTCEPVGAYTGVPSHRVLTSGAVGTPVRP